MTKHLIPFTMAALAVLGIGLAYAETDPGATRDFKAVEESIRRHDNAGYTGNPDVDFRKRLIAKRQEIIAMAEVAIAHTSDEATEALAQKVIANQKRDIAEMKRWLQASQAD